MISTVDPEARHTRKSPEARRDGYRAHVAADPETGIITDEKLTRAAGPENSDAAVAEEFVAAEAAGAARQRHGAPVTAGRRAAAGLVRRLGLRHRGPARRDRRGRPPGGDQAQAAAARRCRAGSPSTTSPSTSRPGTVTCPAGVTRHDHPRPDRHLRRRLPAAARCAQRCTTAKTGRTLILHEHDGLLRAARADWAAGTGLREDYMTHRPNVERAIAQVATWRGRRLKLRYRGDRQEPRLAQAPHRRPQPPQPDRPRPGPPRRRLDPGHLTPGPRPRARGPSRAPARRRPQAHLRRPHGNTASPCTRPRVPAGPAPNPKPA